MRGRNCGEPGTTSAWLRRSRQGKSILLSVWATDMELPGMVPRASRPWLGHHGERRIDGNKRPTPVLQLMLQC
jgi:hypothetical protein